jgi:hypothetical protein
MSNQSLLFSLVFGRRGDSSFQEKKCLNFLFISFLKEPLDGLSRVSSLPRNKGRRTRQKLPKLPNEYAS